MNEQLLEVMRNANREFQEFMDEVSRTGAGVVASRGALRRLEKVDRLLRQVSQWLTSVPHASSDSPEVEFVVVKYRENLKALRNIVETLQFSLLSEKSRLENLRANMQSACAWAATLREIS
jgi:hypothetical protein